MHIAASTRSLWDFAFPAACLQIQELGFDKVEIWLNEEYDQLRPSRVAADPEGSAGLMREASRLTPNAIFVESEVDVETFKGIVNLPSCSGSYKSQSRVHQKGHRSIRK